MENNSQFHLILSNEVTVDANGNFFSSVTEWFLSNCCKSNQPWWKIDDCSNSFKCMEQL